MIQEDRKINKIKIKWEVLQVSKEMPRRQLYGEIHQTLSRNTTCWGATPKCLYTDTCKRDKNKMSYRCICLQGYDFIGIMERWWDGYHGWSVGMEG